MTYSRALKLSLLSVIVMHLVTPAVGVAQPAGPIHTFSDPTLDRVRKQGVLRWGADPSGGAPFVFFDPKNPALRIGFEKDIMVKLAARIGVREQLIEGDWDTLITKLEDKHVDLVMNGLEVNPERAQKVLFTSPYYFFRQQLTIRAADKDKYKGLEDLAGRPIAVLNGSASVDVLKEAGWKLEKIKQYKDSQTPYTEVKLGPQRADAALAESIIAAYYAGNDPELYNVPATLSFGVYAAAVHKDAPGLHAEINYHLEQLKRNGELGGIYEKWNIWNSDQEKLGIAKGVAQDDSDAASGSIPFALLHGTLYTLLLTVLSMPLALLLGLGLALMVRSRRVWLRWPAFSYIQVVRGTPILVQIWLVYFSLPRLGEWMGLGTLLTWEPLVVGILCLAGNYAAYEAEIHRAGIDAVPKGQREAALALGLSEGQTLVRIILPQSFRIILPPVINDLISMLKDSCIVSVISVPELLYMALGIGRARFSVPEMMVVSALIYLVLSLAADRFGKLVEVHLRSRGLPAVQPQLAHH